MGFWEEQMRHIPEYYDEMYQDGFTPDEIMYAVKKKMDREYRERIQKQQQEKEFEKELEKRMSEIIEKTLDDLLDNLNFNNK